jgi:multidrug transporter EmrE-like cation transporter
MDYLLLILALTLNALANVLLKMGATRLPGWSEPGAMTRLLANPYLLTGLTLFALNVVFYAAALSRLNLSVAYPVMVAGGLIVVVVASVVWLREPMTTTQLSGIVLLVLGILLVTHRSDP